MARVVMADDQLSLAIGKGSKCTFGSKLTGWKIDIKRSQLTADSEEDLAEE